MNAIAAKLAEALRHCIPYVAYCAVREHPGSGPRDVVDAAADRAVTALVEYEAVKDAPGVDAADLGRLVSGLDWATDEIVPRWWDDSHGNAYKEGWNDCRNTARAIHRAAGIVLSCDTCNGHGMVGGPSYREPDEGGVPCPDCNAPQSGANK